MAKKATKTVKVGRGSDQFVLRLPAGMRDMIAREAAMNGRSMNAEIVDRLDFSFQEIISKKGLNAISLRLLATTEALEAVFFNIRDFDLDGFMADQRKAGNPIKNRAEAVWLIMTEYLSSKGYLK